MKGPRSEDWIAVCLGGILLGLVLTLVVRQVAPDPPPFKWATDAEVWRRADSQRPVIEAYLAQRPIRDPNLFVAVTIVNNAIKARARRPLDTLLPILHLNAQHTRNVADKDAALKIRRMLAPASNGPAALFWPNNLRKSVALGGALLVLSALGVALMGGPVGRFVVGFPALYALAWGALVLGGNATLSAYGLVGIVWAFGVGLLIGNLFGLPSWLAAAAQTGLYLKTGLVLLGASVLFGEFLGIGVFVLAQMMLTVGVVWVGCFVLARQRRIDDQLGAPLAAAISFGGVWGALPAWCAVRGERREFSLVTVLALFASVPMFLGLPWIVRRLGMPDLVAGAWLGGALDSSTALAATGTLVNDSAIQLGTAVKLAQNAVLAGGTLVLSLWWAIRPDARSGARPGIAAAWERFPPAVLGFLAAAGVFSCLVPEDVVLAARNMLSWLQTVWFVLAFLCLGLETRARDLFSPGGGRAALVFVGAQIVSLGWGLILAHLLLGGTQTVPVPIG